MALNCKTFEVSETTVALAQRLISCGWLTCETDAKSLAKLAHLYVMDAMQRTMESERTKEMGLEVTT